MKTELDFIAEKGKLIRKEGKTKVYAVNHIPARIKDLQISVTYYRNKQKMNWTFYPVEVAFLLGLLSEGLSWNEIKKRTGYGQDLLDAVRPHLEKIHKKKGGERWK